MPFATSVIYMIRLLPDVYVGLLQTRTSATATAAASSASGVSSLTVLRYEKQLLDQQIAKYQSKLKPSELEALQNKGRGIDRQIIEISERLKKGGVPAYKSMYRECHR
jgi:hypothetical protein